MNMTEIINILSVFMVLFAVVDTIGVLPILVDLQKSGKNINATKTTVIATFILFAFLFGGEWLLKLFNVDFSSFAVAGSIVLFFLSLEMILETNIFKHNSTEDVTVIPIAFPLIAGPGSITTLISLRAEYDLWVISIALALNMVVVFVVMKLAVRIEKIMGTTINYIIKKFFGIILLAMAVKLFASNVGILINH
ncbi:MAG: MarC family protein [Paludibacteraceae bacterium]|nr:MarC family protein [Paludibacteraceae bacterium]HOU67218.1 MarC family protein [Paludibacteraceae bacterium]HQF49459.1 MarC family protein [Paludibacteraceae bacterium]HQJ89264.1 MarC family protein [Paludibacteraceae bacterium]